MAATYRPVSNIEIFYRPDNPSCAELRFQLRDRGVRATWRSVTAQAIVAEINGSHGTVPTVRVGSTALADSSWRRLRSLIARAAAPEDGQE